MTTSLIEGTTYVWSHGDMVDNRLDWSIDNVKGENQCQLLSAQAEIVGLLGKEAVENKWGRKLQVLHTNACCGDAKCGKAWW